jgi:hypothetical protein
LLLLLLLLLLLRRRRIVSRARKTKGRKGTKMNKTQKPFQF